MKRMKMIFKLMLAVFALSAMPADAATLSIGRVSIDNVGMNKRMLRLNDYGLMVDHSGLCVEVTVNFNIEGLMGDRVVCEVAPLGANGGYLEDSKGDAAAVEGITVLSNSYSGKVVVPLPYSWVMNEGNKSRQAVRLLVTLASFGDDQIIEQKEVTLSGSDINIDGRKMGNKLMGDILGGGSGGGGLVGGLLGSLFDTSDAESTQECPSCEGCGVCPHCDGDGFFVVSACRKCQQDPGVCRRCKGEGTVTIKIDLY